MKIVALIVGLGSLVPGAAPAADDLWTRGDEFTSSATAGAWSHRHAEEAPAVDPFERYEINAASHPGAMLMQPRTVSWYEGYRGPLVYKPVAGDFAFTTRVTVDNHNGTGLPTSAFSLAGAMLRTPPPVADAPEDYVFLSLGYGEVNHPSQPGPGPHFEVKTTNNGNSNLNLSPANTLTASLQLARLGSTVVALYQRPGEAWTVHRVYQRPDLPGTLQAGLVAYTDWDKVATYTPAFHNAHTLAPPIPDDPSTNPALPFRPDLVATFDFARFARPVVPPGIDPATATAGELLTFLGAHAVPPPLMPGDINLDGRVDSRDTALFAENLGQTSGATWTTGDFDGDRWANLLDLAILQANLGQFIAPSATAVPEPNFAWWLTLAATFSILVSANRRKRLSSQRWCKTYTRLNAGQEVPTGKTCGTD